MPLTNKSGWLKALRSGEYVKGHGHMRQNGKRCCLAVYCEVLGLKPSKVGRKWIYPIPFQLMHTQSVLDLGRPAGFGGLSAQDCNTLIRMNDSADHRSSFSYIADWIEENLE